MGSRTYGHWRRYACGRLEGMITDPVYEGSHAGLIDLVSAARFRATECALCTPRWNNGAECIRRCRAVIEAPRLGTPRGLPRRGACVAEYEDGEQRGSGASLRTTNSESLPKRRGRSTSRAAPANRRALPFTSWSSEPAAVTRPTASSWPTTTAGKIFIESARDEYSLLEGKYRANQRVTTRCAW